MRRSLTRSLIPKCLTGRGGLVPRLRGRPHSSTVRCQQSWIRLRSSPGWLTVQRYVRRGCAYAKRNRWVGSRDTGCAFVVWGVNRTQGVPLCVVSTGFEPVISSVSWKRAGRAALRDPLVVLGEVLAGLEPASARFAGEWLAFHPQHRDVWASATRPGEIRSLALGPTDATVTICAEQCPFGTVRPRTRLT